MDALIEELRTEPTRQRVVDQLIAPAIRQRSFSAPHKRFTLVAIAESAKGLHDEELGEALRRLLAVLRCVFHIMV